MELIIVNSLFVARKFAEALSSRNKRNGYFQGDKYFIVWLNNKSGVAGDKPSVLIPFLFEKPENPQIDVIKKLIRLSKFIIAVNGAVIESAVSVPVYNIWISALTRNCIQLTLKNFRKSICFSVNTCCSPPLGCNLENCSELHLPAQLEFHNQQNLESGLFAYISNYTKKNPVEVEKHYEIELQFKKDFSNFKCYSVTKWSDQDSAKEALQALVRKGTMSILQATYKKKAENSPHLFNLVDLQIYCNEQLGITAMETVSILNNLYEKGFVTYPFPTSNKLLFPQWNQILAIISALHYKESIVPHFEQLKWGRFNKKIDPPDHPFMNVIFPTGIIPSALNKLENAVYDRIALRLLEAVSEPYQYEVMHLELAAINYRFESRARVLEKPGWKSFVCSMNENNTDTLAHLPHLSKNESLKIHKARINEIQVEEKQRLTEAKLLNIFKTHADPVRFACAVEQLIKKARIRRNFGALTP